MALSCRRIKSSTHSAHPVLRSENAISGIDFVVIPISRELSFAIENSTYEILLLGSHGVAIAVLSMVESFCGCFDVRLNPSWKMVYPK